MKLLQIAVVLVTLGAVSSNSAADFSGLGLAAEMQFKSTGGSAGYAQVGSDYRQSGKYSEGGEQEIIGGVNLSFGFAVSPEVLIQVGASADLGETTLNEGSYTYSEPGYTENGSHRVKEKIII